MKRNAILHGVTALCSALVYAFYALPFYSMSGQSQSGYQYLDNFFQMKKVMPDALTAMQTFATAAGIMLLIVAGLAFVASVVLLLCDLEVIKNEMVTKIAAWATLVTVGLLVVVAILNLIANVLVVKDINDSIPAEAGVKYVAGWAMTILTTVCALGACGTTAYAHFKK